jgi:SAM-dependent methyltransferase
MNPSLLPVPGVPANADKDYLERTQHIVPLVNRRVLCIGYNQAELDQFVAPFRPAEISVLTFWEGHQDTLIKKYPLTIADITKPTPFADGAFDAILTLSLLEHLTPLEDALNEMRRILRPGGHLCALFGPAWSSPHGHHIYERAGDPLLDFSVWKMPAHIHLLCSPQEIVNYYRECGYGDSGGLIAQHWFYETKIINRLMYEDYVRLLGERFQWCYQELMYNTLPEEHLAELRRKFPPYRDFTTYGARYILQRG